MSSKLRVYRVAGGTTCPEAIIFYLLLYALLYIQNTKLGTAELPLLTPGDFSHI